MCFLRAAPTIAALDAEIGKIVLVWGSKEMTDRPLESLSFNVYHPSVGEEFDQHSFSELVF